MSNFNENVELRCLMKTVSIHIVTYNSENDIDKCLDAVFNQTYPILQIIIVDNASRDKTASLLGKYSEKTESVFNSINVGFAKAHNQAIELSKTDYCLVLNPDVSLHPDYIKELISYAEKNGHIGSLTGKLYLGSNTDTIDSCGLRINKVRRAFDIGNGISTNDLEERVAVFGVSGAAAFYNMTMVKELSFQNEFFDETFFAYKEDVDVAWRAQLFGWKAAVVFAAVAYHERGWKTGSRKNQSLFIKKYSYINRYKMIFKNDNPMKFLKHLPFIIPFEIISFAYLVLREPQVLIAWRRFVDDYSRMKAWRKFIKSNTKNKYNEIYEFFI
jgi:GT2 family glycosyltransferase